MHDYFYGRFPLQLARLTFRRPNDVVCEQIMRDPGVVFFGGPDWENVATDLGTVPETDRPRFILSLFMVVLTDQALYTYFRDAYEAWRRRTNFPKFGWSGFGPHNENPFKILWAPEREGIIDIHGLLALIPEFMRFFVGETRTYFRQHLPAVGVRNYFDAIRGDRGYAFHQGVVVPRVKAEFEALTNA
jgi:hypothetical protein